MHRLGTACSGALCTDWCAGLDVALYLTCSAGTCRLQLASNACHAYPCSGVQCMDWRAVTTVYMMHVPRYTFSNSLDLKQQEASIESGVDML